MIQCPGEDSNLHGPKATTPSRWRVYQFHHLGFSIIIKEIRPMEVDDIEFTKYERKKQISNYRIWPET